MDDIKKLAQDFTWASTKDKRHSQEAKDRATSLYIIKGIAAKYGGTVEVDMLTNTLNLLVPKENEVACSFEIEQALARMKSDCV